MLSIQRCHRLTSDLGDLKRSTCESEEEDKCFSYAQSYTTSWIGYFIKVIQFPLQYCTFLKTRMDLFNESPDKLSQPAPPSGYSPSPLSTCLLKGPQSRADLQQTYFAWDLPGEIAVGGELETTGVLGGDVHDVDVPRLLKDRKLL